MTDRRTVTLVIALLGMCALILVGTVAAIALLEVEPSDAMTGALFTLTGNVTGALGTLLVSTRSAPPPDA